MPVRLVALDEGPDILLDRAMVVVGRHPSCDTRLDSLRVSRQHCCMSQDKGEVTVRDLGSTNGIRINGQRVERGRLRPGDELSIAHIRFRLENGQGHEQTIVESDGLLGGPPQKEDVPRNRPHRHRQRMEIVPAADAPIRGGAKTHSRRPCESCYPTGLLINAGSRSSYRWLVTRKGKWRA